MDFGLSRRETIVKTRTHSTILNETDVQILASQNQPANKGCYSSPNSSGIVDMNFTASNSGLKKDIINTSSNTINQNQHSFSSYDEMVNAKLRENEAYRKHLNSIDLTKYSFPNENKPKTDYTYARTSSYVSNSKLENCPMPNLCRRSRITPPKNRLINFPFSSTTENLHVEDMIKRSMIKRSTERISFFSKVKSYVTPSNSSKTKEATLTQTGSASQSFTENKPPVAKVYSSSSVTPRLNIGPFLEEEDAQATRNKNTIRHTTKKQGSCLKSLFVWILLGLILLPIFMFSMQRMEAKKDFTLDDAFLEDIKIFLKHEIQTPLIKKSNDFWKEAEVVAGAWTAKGIKNFAYNFEVIKNSVNEHTRTMMAYISELWQLYWPKICRKTHELFICTCDTISKIYQLLKRTITDTHTNIVNTVEYKLPTFRHDNSETDEEKKEIIKNYHLLKEKIFREAMEIVQDSLKKTDIDSMRQELDMKFNYTLSLMASKITDQSMQIELSQANHEKAMKHMKDVLNELETRYSQSMESLQEKLNSQTQIIEEQNQKQLTESQSLDPHLQERIKSLIQSSNQHISFQQIEEYINKTFYLYNADKTGMPDFASEYLGGKILFTRCTEDYNDHTRYFTIFNFPISRLVVSPRVVIQGTVQPGNCWAFKGSEGDLFIRLAARITPTSFSLEHIPKELSLTGVIDSAPQNFTVYGYIKDKEEEIFDEDRYLLGNYRYDNNSKSTLQFFDVQHTYKDTPIRVIELKIESNAGNKECTCLYKFRVHGKMFQEAERIESETDQHEIEN